MMPTDASETLHQRYQREAQIDAQIQLWEGWRDVRVHGYPRENQPVIFCINTLSVFGVFVGGYFCLGEHQINKCPVTLWQPMPDPLPPDVHARLVAEATKEKT